MYGYVYLTYCKPLNMYYVGQHKAETFEPEKYIGSGSFFDWGLKKFGRDNFTCECLYEAGANDDINIVEALAIDHYWHKFGNLLNLNTMSDALKFKCCLPKVPFFCAVDGKEEDNVDIDDFWRFDDCFYHLESLLDIVKIKDFVEYTAAKKGITVASVTALECIETVYGDLYNFGECLLEYEVPSSSNDYLVPKYSLWSRDDINSFPISYDFLSFAKCFNIPNNPDSWEKYRKHLKQLNERSIANVRNRD